MPKLLIVLICLLSFFNAHAKAKVDQLKYQPKAILKSLLQHKQLEPRPDIEFPKIVFASKAKLKDFQDDVEPQWHMRPQFISNVYVTHLNKIYINDESAYYKKTGRCMDDSLAHELTHYIQFKYRGWSLDDESLEWDAIDAQTWFRDSFCKKIK